MCNLFSLILILPAASGVLRFTDPQVLKVTVTAAHIAQTIGATGRITLDGIVFEDGKHVIKPESEPVLREIASYLRKQPGVSLRVESVDARVRSKTLAQQRADAVLHWLITKAGIPAGRLEASGGGGPDAAKERFDENRRSESRGIRLVKK